MGLATSYIHLFYGVFYLLFCLQKCLSVKIPIDLESYDCTHMEPFKISDMDVVNIFARPRSDVPSRTTCIIRLKASPGRRFNVYLRDIYITDCGINLSFFDREYPLKNPFESFGCQSSPGPVFNTHSNTLIIKLSKYSSAATRYRIRIELVTDRGPRLGPDVDQSNRTKKQSLTLMTLFTTLLISWLLR